MMIKVLYLIPIMTENWICLLWNLIDVLIWIEICSRQHKWSKIYEKKLKGLTNYAKNQISEQKKWI